MAPFLDMWFTGFTCYLFKLNLSIAPVGFYGYMICLGVGTLQMIGMEKKLQVVVNFFVKRWAVGLEFLA